VIDAFARNGIGRRPLRAIADEVGTSHRMLLHHFGSRDELIVAVVEEVERRQAVVFDALPAEPVAAFAAMWADLRRPALRALERLFFECYARAAQGEAPFTRLLPAAVQGWLDAADRHGTGGTGGIGAPRDTSGAGDQGGSSDTSGAGAQRSAGHTSSASPQGGAGHTSSASHQGGAGHTSSVSDQCGASRTSGVSDQRGAGPTSGASHQGGAGGACPAGRVDDAKTASDARGRVDPAFARLGLAVMRGLLLDLVATDDEAGVDAAAAAFGELLRAAAAARVSG